MVAAELAQPTRQLGGAQRLLELRQVAGRPRDEQDHRHVFAGVRQFQDLHRRVNVPVPRAGAANRPHARLLAVAEKERRVVRRLRVERDRPVALEVDRVRQRDPREVAQDAGLAINGWVEKRTENKVKELLKSGLLGRAGEASPSCLHPKADGKQQPGGMILFAAIFRSNSSSPKLDNDARRGDWVCISAALGVAWNSSEEFGRLNEEQPGFAGRFVAE